MVIEQEHSNPLLVRTLEIGHPQTLLWQTRETAPVTTNWEPDPPLGRLLDAMLAVASDLSLSVVLRRIVESATALVDAQYGALGVIGPEGQLAEFVNHGLDDDTVAKIGTLPEGKGILGRLISDPEPLRLRDLTQHPDSYGFPPHHPPMRSFLGVPIRVRDRVFGNLYLCEKRSADEFTAEDEALAITLALAAGVAIENARLYGQLQELVVIEDRERIARDLHDKVIQQLFATGMSLQAAHRLVTDDGVAHRLTQAVDDLDTTIREIRNTIFALHPPVTGLRTELVAVVGELDERLGVRIALHVEGPIDQSIPRAIAEHVPSVIREAVTNAARHGQAKAIDILIRADADCTVRVVDDGGGVRAGGEETAGSGQGLANLAHRAESLGGSVVLEHHHDGGTILEWKVPLDPR